jgi:hypothetical protein
MVGVTVLLPYRVLRVIVYFEAIDSLLPPCISHVAVDLASPAVCLRQSVAELVHVFDSALHAMHDEAV